MKSRLVLIHLRATEFNLVIFSQPSCDLAVTLMWPFCHLDADLCDKAGPLLPQSNPVQVLLCVIVLLDAGIVIAQILLDLNSVKGQSSVVIIALRSSVYW